MMETVNGIQPVILIGMHRSGTSLLCRLLSELGLFVGDDLQDEHESVFFIRCNDWILRQGQSTWDHPERFLRKSRDPEWIKQLASKLRDRLSGTKSFRYAGSLPADISSNQLTRRFPWGWKDPRNSFTLPVWLELYPDARVIHITRHGVDVAQSLVTRERRLRQRIVSLTKALAVLWPRTDSGQLANPWRCTTLDGAFSLWEAYMHQARMWVSERGDQSCQIVYENFLQEPVTTLSRLCRFIGLPDAEENIQRIAMSVSPGRAFAYRNAPELVAYAQSISSRLASFGYEA